MDRKIYLRKDATKQMLSLRHKLKSMKLTLPFLIALILVSCNHSTDTKDIKESKIEENVKDTVLVKIENKINKSYEVGFYAKSYTYCWLVEKDTLDFKIGLTQYMRDSAVHLRIFHRNPILFSDVLDKINESLPLIKQDFNMNKLSSLYLEPPIFYKDMTIELSKQYKNQFGDRIIKSQELNEFLINSWLGDRIDILLNQFDKSAKRYGIEKFHLLKKKDYEVYIPNSDLNDYPSFSINGMGISVILNEKQ